MRFVVSAVRLAYDGRTDQQHARRCSDWLNALGEAPLRPPDARRLPAHEAAWASSGQMSRRFEIARAIGSGNAGLFDPEDGGAATAAGFPQLSTPAVLRGARAVPGRQTRATRCRRARSQQEWNTFLLASPDFNYE